MPKSKREKKISLTKTNKKGLQLKQQVIDNVQKCLEEYARVFVFSVENMRNSKIKEVRQQWKHSRIFFGKNKVMAKALGNDPESEIKENIHKVSKKLKGQCGLLFTNKTKMETVKWFENYCEVDFARSGNAIMDTIIISEGPLKQFSHAMEPQLRQLGVPVKLDKGVIMLTNDYTICKIGDVLTPEQSRVLKLFGYKLAEFKVILKCIWSNDGTFENLNSNIDMEETKEEEIDDVSSSDEE